MFYLEKYPYILKKRLVVLKSPAYVQDYAIQCVEGEKSAYIYIKMFIVATTGGLHCK